jgi:hypothetical protein
MSFYKCGHDRGIVILDDDPLCFLAYLEWKDSTGYDGDKTLCWECWCEKQREDEKKLPCVGVEDTAKVKKSVQ